MRKADRLFEIIQILRRSKKPVTADAMAAELETSKRSVYRDIAALLPADFLRTTPYAQLPHFPRYLKAMKARAERWRQNPTKDAERAAQLAPFVAAAAKLREREGGEAFRWLVEEFRVSLFAQELGTAEPVSTVKLDRALAALQHGIALPRTEPPVAKPILAAGVTEKKIAPVKNFGALDRLFPR